ncbi:MAG: hypothetical protein DCF13_02860 [Flavobacteriaceae bacterium]|nr:MAG: hypothetical protein DCF13_02860 [Flavobacteriaceae bacterium]
MKKRYAIFCFLIIFSSYSQQVQFAHKVIKYSTDLGGKQHGIKRILGKPDAFPQGGSSPNAWTPKNALDGYEFVEVSFENPQTVKQVAVFENLNAGCVVKISVDTGNGKYQTVWYRKKDWKTPSYKSTLHSDRSYYFGRKRRKIEKSPDVNVNPAVEYAILETAVANVVAVRVEFNFALIPGQKQIDAIGISDSENPISVDVNSLSKFENLSDPKVLILDEFTPVNPTISHDGKKLFITNGKDGKDEIYSFTKDANGNWSNKFFEKTLNSDNSYNYVEYTAQHFLLKGGNPITKGNTNSGFELFTPTTDGYQSLGAVKISAYNNYDDTADATMTSDGKTLIMAIETDFTQGGTDLYFTNKKEDGTFGLLQNMGKVINSAADEGMCHLLSDNKTLLFSSNGFSTYGDYDIFITYRLDDTWKNWSEPINLGSKINSNDFDGLPFYDENSEQLYYISIDQGSQVMKVIVLPKAIIQTPK